MLRRLAFAVIVFAATTAAQAAPQRLALVIGNAAYGGGAMPALANPSNDAALMADRLEAAGFDVTLLLDADLRTMTVALRDFADGIAAQEDALALFFFAGHGVQANGANYLVPVGADLRDEVDAEFEAFAVDRVLARLEAAHDGANVVILDACRDTALSRSVGGGLALMGRTPPGSFISFATAPGSTAADGAGVNSPYTAAIAAELLVAGQSIEDMFKNVRRRVVAATGGDQVPWDHSSLTTEVVFVPDGAAVARPAAPEGTPQLQVELQFWGDVKDSGDPAQLRAYLDAFPDGAFAPLARARIAAAEAEAGGADVERLFAELTRRSAIVENPTRPHEFYANARLHELRGDYLRARQDYLKYFAFDPPYVDPHLRFQRFLRAQDGQAGAQQVYRALAGGASVLPTGFAASLLMDRDARIAALEAIVEQNPDYAPAVYQLSLEYSQERLGAQGTADKERERVLLERFTELAESGHFLRHYIDQQAAADALEDAEIRLAALSSLNVDALSNPVSIVPMRSNTGWTVTIQITDQVREIFVAEPGGEFRSTGFMGHVNSATGYPMPRSFIELPPDIDETTIRVRYTDLRGRMQGPYDVSFRAAGALEESQKQILQMTRTAWVAPRLWDGRWLLYFSHLLSYRCGIAEVAYGYDGDALDRTFPLPECDLRDPIALPDGVTIYESVPAGAVSVSVRLTFRDGTQSETATFPIR